LRAADFFAAVFLRAGLRAAVFFAVVFRRAVVLFLVAVVFLAAVFLRAGFRAAVFFPADLFRAAVLRAAIPFPLSSSGFRRSLRRHAFEAPPFPFAHPAPDAVPLIPAERVVETFDPNGALRADPFGLP
jgi:hypothetical protein